MTSPSSALPISKGFSDNSSRCFPAQCAVGAGDCARFVRIVCVQAAFFVEHFTASRARGEGASAIDGLPALGALYESVGQFRERQLFELHRVSGVLAAPMPVGSCKSNVAALCASAGHVSRGGRVLPLTFLET